MGRKTRRHGSAEQFFEYQGIKDDEKGSYVAYHLDDNAQIWFQVHKEEGENIGWERMKKEVQMQYGSTTFQIFFGNLTKLKQGGTVHDYHTELMRLLSRVGQLLVEQQVRCFVNGLKDFLRIDVQALRPTSLLKAIGLAILYESKTVDSRKGHIPDLRRPYVASTNTPPLPSSTLPRARLRMVKRLNPDELRERRRKGLCFNCDKRFSPGHRCKRLFYIEGYYPEEDYSVDEERLE